MEIATDALFVNRVYDGRVGDRQSISPIGIGEDRQLYTSDRADEWCAFASLLLGTIASSRSYTQAVEYIYGMGNAISTSIATMVICCSEYIKTRVPKSYSKCLGGGKHRITAVGTSSKGCLQVAYC